MKYLGVDYGTKRIGLAISDETGTLGLEWQTLTPKEFWKNIQDIIKEQKIAKIAVGLPLNMQGVDTKKTIEVRTFALQLEKETTASVELIDERLSSQMAGKIAGKKKGIDALAASIILQTFLDKQSAVVR